MTRAQQIALLDWYAVNHRDLPWRRTRDPYAIWVSEIMCQQTQVATVIPYYERWMARFPDAESLARASVDEVLALWQGLGYYRRGRNLQAGAQQILESQWPDSASAWLSITGVGAYTAAAIASITLDEPAAVVDGNVERVYARFNGDPSVGSQLKSAAQKWASHVIWHEQPGDWNQAMMELGATICRPRQPLCDLCPISKGCKALAEGRVDELPTPKPRLEVVELNWNVWVPVYQGKLGLEQIPEGRWWHGLWRFSTTEDGGNPFDKSPIVAELPNLTHTVTHHRIRFQTKVVQLPRQDSSLEWHSEKSIVNLALPAPYKKIAKHAFDLASMKNRR